MTVLYHPAVTINDKEFQLIQTLIYHHAGIFLKDHKRTMAANRLRKRLESFGFSSYLRYYQFLTRDPEGNKELAEFINCLTTNETYFFRHPEQFAFLIEQLMPELMRRKGQTKIRIWCAACSSGEEPYSIAMLLDDWLSDAEWRSIEIVGTDINQRMLDKAKEGLYGSYSVSKMPKVYRLKYFTVNEKGDKFLLSETIKSRICFIKHNLIEPFHQRPFDVVFCRNVLIYFNEESKRKALANLHRSMKKGGHLIIDYALSLFNNQQFFTYRKPTVYQKVS